MQSLDIHLRNKLIASCELPGCLLSIIYGYDHSWLLEKDMMFPTQYQLLGILDEGDLYGLVPVDFDSFVLECNDKKLGLKVNEYVKNIQRVNEDWVYFKSDSRDIIWNPGTQQTHVMHVPTSDGVAYKGKVYYVHECKCWEWDIQQQTHRIVMTQVRTIVVLGNCLCIRYLKGGCTILGEVSMIECDYLYRWQDENYEINIGAVCHETNRVCFPRIDHVFAMQHMVVIQQPDGISVWNLRDSCLDFYELGSKYNKLTCHPMSNNRMYTVCADFIHVYK